jgi:protein-S-isoprenylcysteine O-methyltransferase Ste14
VANLLPFIRFASLATTLLVAVVASAKMSVVSAKIKSRKEKENKMSVTIKRNLILLALAGIFFFVAKSGLDEMAKTGLDGLGIFPFLIGGFGFLGFSIGLVVRLWGNEKE